MEINDTRHETGVKIPPPYTRQIQVLLAPDKHNVAEVTFSVVHIDPGGQTDYHAHDRPELIYIVYGEGIGVCEGKESPLQEDVVLWVRAGEKHQIKNTGKGILKLATVFTPAYTAEENYSRCVQAAKKLG
jgi:mannose-6-phosphate isomerase-like protein (cupin superfamily)